MSDQAQVFPDVASVLNDRFRGHSDRPWEEWIRIAVEDASAVADEAERAWVVRRKASHRTIGSKTALRHLIASCADQSFLDEIGRLDGLERLELEYEVTAADLAPLGNLRNLRHLRIECPRKIVDFSPLLDLPALRTLLIGQPRHMADLDWLASAHHLEVIGIEGGMWSTLTIPSFRPLAGLRSLRALFAVSTRLADKDLSPLAQCPRLEYLNIARVAPREEFERLKASKPALVCDWFRDGMWAAARRLSARG